MIEGKEKELQNIPGVQVGEAEMQTIRRVELRSRDINISLGKLFINWF